MRKMMLFALLLLICSFGCLALEDRMRLEGDRLAFLEREIAALERECDVLVLEIAAATSPEALAADAEALGMVLAEEKDRAWLAADREERVPAEAEPQEDVFDVFGDLLRRGI
ncbi:MAG: hypothetical protein IJF43_04660 [Firmicutes bacterium]|nr:hypothetical protein [Bacillota bacterium]